MVRKASAVWVGSLKEGKGTISTDSGVLSNTPYSFTTRFENAHGHQSRGIDRGRARRMLHHGAFRAARQCGHHRGEAGNHRIGDARKARGRLYDHQDSPGPEREYQGADRPPLKKPRRTRKRAARFRACSKPKSRCPPNCKTKRPSSLVSGAARLRARPLCKTIYKIKIAKQSQKSLYCDSSYTR